MKRIVKLINNERINTKLLSKKACDSTSTDTCTYIDNADCSMISYDRCNKDYAGCGAHSIDDCSFYASDLGGCYNGNDDYSN